MKKVFLSHTLDQYELVIKIWKKLMTFLLQTLNGGEDCFVVEKWANKKELDGRLICKKEII